VSAERVVAVIATRNRPGLLASRSLPSLVSQRRLPDLLVVVDDSDPPWREANRRALEQVLAAGVEVVYELARTAAQGAAASWNQALRRAAGRETDCWVALLDDDDRWHPDHLAVCLEVAARSGAEGVVSGIRTIVGDDRPSGRPLARLVLTDFLAGNPGWQGSNTFVRLGRLLALGGFSEELPSTLDRDLAIRLILAGWVHWAFTRQFTVDYFLDPARQALSSRGSPAKLEGLRRFHDRYVALMSDEVHRAFCARAEELFGAPPGQYRRAPLVDRHARLRAAANLGRCLAGAPVTLLGHGREGVVLTEGARVYKLFDGWTGRQDCEIEKMVRNIEELMRVAAGRSWAPQALTLRQVGALWVLTYDHQASIPYTGGRRGQVAGMVGDLARGGLMYLGMRPSSFRVCDDRLVLVDIGCDVVPFEQAAIAHNLVRACLMIEHGLSPRLRALQRRALAGTLVEKPRALGPFVRECGLGVEP